MIGLSFNNIFYYILYILDTIRTLCSHNCAPSRFLVVLRGRRLKSKVSRPWFCGKFTELHDLVLTSWTGTNRLGTHHWIVLPYSWEGLVNWMYHTTSHKKIFICLRHVSHVRSNGWYLETVNLTQFDWALNQGAGFPVQVWQQTGGESISVPTCMRIPRHGSQVAQKLQIFFSPGTKKRAENTGGYIKPKAGYSPFVGLLIQMPCPFWSF